MSFNQATRQSFIQLGNGLTYSANGVSSIQLPQVGFLAKIIIPIAIAYTTAATGTYVNITTGLNFTPYGLVRRVILRTNEGAEIYNTSGMGNYLVQRTLRTATDVRNPLTSANSTNAANAVFQIPATMTTSTAYTQQFALVIPVAWGDSLAAGLILLQNPTTRLTLEIQWGDLSVDDFTLGGTTPALSVTSVTATPMMEVYNLPANTNDYPDLSMLHVILEDTTPIVSTGDFTYRPPLGNLYLNVIHQFINNSAAMVPANFSKYSLNYAQTQTAYTITPQQQGVYQRYRNGGIDMPDGVVQWGFDYGTGFPEIGNMRDVVDTSRLTDLSIISTINTSVTLTTASVRTVREMLAPLAR